MGLHQRARRRESSSLFMKMWTALAISWATMIKWKKQRRSSMTWRWILLPTTSTNLTCRINIMWAVSVSYSKEGRQPFNPWWRTMTTKFLERYKKEEQALWPSGPWWNISSTISLARTRQVLVGGPWCPSRGKVAGPKSSVGTTHVKTRTPRAAQPINSTAGILSPRRRISHVPGQSSRKTWFLNCNSSTKWVPSDCFSGRKQGYIQKILGEIPHRYWWFGYEGGGRGVHPYPSWDNILLKIKANWWCLGDCRYHGEQCLHNAGGLRHRGPPAFCHQLRL